jgi:transposase
MARRILAPISSNSRPNHELSDEKKHLIVRRYLGGQSLKEISEAECVRYGTVWQVIQRYKERGTTDNKPRSGRPEKVIARDIRAIARAARRLPKATLKELKQESGVDFSRTTIKKVLHRKGLKHWCAKHRLELIERLAAIRL